ncbi:unnamed protein product [Moneuplotes crassus]|uniref:Uncharacterized protein n=1 Tax=Euplotes crassus TaxID=5936 RepID=A0AAD1XUV8_EUPCR|nr:unnamed protein product [Moneuplotes crassus]
MSRNDWKTLFNKQRKMTLIQPLEFRRQRASPAKKLGSSFKNFKISKTNEYENGEGSIEDKNRKVLYVKKWLTKKGRFNTPDLTRNFETQYVQNPNERSANSFLRSRLYNAADLKNTLKEQVKAPSKMVRNHSRLKQEIHLFPSLNPTLLKNTSSAERNPYRTEEAHDCLFSKKGYIIRRRILGDHTDFERKLSDDPDIANSPITRGPSLKNFKLKYSMKEGSDMAGYKGLNSSHIESSPDRNASLGKAYSKASHPTFASKMKEFDSLLKNKMHRNLKRKASKTFANPSLLKFSEFKLKPKPKRKGIKLEQLHKEAEIFILKSKRKKFTQEDLNRFIREVEIRKDLEELNTGTLNCSILTKNTVEDQLVHKKEENALGTYDKYMHTWNRIKQNISKWTSKGSSDSSILRIDNSHLKPSSHYFCKQKKQAKRTKMMGNIKRMQINNNVEMIKNLAKNKDEEDALLKELTDQFNQEDPEMTMLMNNMNLSEPIEDKKEDTFEQEFYTDMDSTDSCNDFDIDITTSIKETKDRQRDNIKIIDDFLVIGKNKLKEELGNVANLLTDPQIQNGERNLYLYTNSHLDEEGIGEPNEKEEVLIQN